MWVAFTIIYLLQELVGHLVKYRIGHWDQAIRELAAKSLACITNSTVDCILILRDVQLLTW